MAYHNGPKVVTRGLQFLIDAKNPKCYAGSGNSVYDLVGNYDGAITGSVTFNSEGSWQFGAGASSYIDFNDIYSADALTISVWVKLDVVPGSQASAYPQFWGKRDIDTQRSYFFAIAKASEKLYWEFKDSSANYYTVEADISYWSAGVWYNVVGTYDASSGIGHVYINGEQPSETYSPVSPWSLDPIPDTSARTRIGGGGSYYVDGAIAHTSYYDVALTAQEVSQNYNALKGRFDL